MERESLLALKQKINPQTYRQLTIDISCRHFCTNCYFEDEKNNPAMDETLLENVIAQQIAHSLSMTKTMYARALQNQSRERTSVQQRYREISLI